VSVTHCCVLYVWACVCVQLMKSVCNLVKDGLRTVKDVTVLVK
jgi:hypothetical protein